MAKSLYFRADDGFSGSELWRVKDDGSVVQAADLDSEYSSDPTALTTFSNQLYFFADSDTGEGLHKVSREGDTEFVSAVEKEYDEPAYFTPWNGNLYFSGYGDSGQELWKIDNGQVSLAANIASEDGGYYGVDSNPSDLTVYNDALYFNAEQSDSQGSELWKYNEESGASLVKDIHPQEGSNPQNLTPFNGALYFSAKPDNQTGEELQKLTSDGQVEQVKNINTTDYEGSDPTDFFTFSNALYFTADQGGDVGDALYRVTDSGAVEMVEDFEGDYSGESDTVTEGVEYNGNYYFGADGGTAGDELWKLTGDGSAEKVKNIYIGDYSADSNPAEFTKFNDSLYFAATSATHGRELWRLDQDGTVGEAANIRPEGEYGSEGSDPTNLTVFNNKLYFEAEGSDTQGRELWQLDTEGNASLAKDINTEYSGANSDIGDFEILDQPDNFAPTGISLGSQSVTAGQTGATVGSVTVTDFDDSSHSFNVSDDRFTIQDGELTLGEGKSVSADQTSSIDLSITATDSASNTYTEQFTLSVTESGATDGDKGLQTHSGWFDSGSTLADAIEVPADARYIKVFNMDASGYLSGGTGSAPGPWLAPGDLDQIDLEEGTYFAQSWGDGLGDWMNFNARLGSADNQIALSNESFAPGTEVSLDQVVEPDQMASNGQVRVVTPQTDYGWLSDDELSTQTLTAPSDGEKMPLWVDTFLSGEGRSGWARTSVEGDASDDSTTLVGGLETTSDDGGAEIG